MFNEMLNLFFIKKKNEMSKGRETERGVEECCGSAAKEQVQVDPQQRRKERQHPTPR